MMTVAAALSPESSMFLGNKGPEQLAAGDQQGERGQSVCMWVGGYGPWQGRERKKRESAGWLLQPRRARRRPTLRAPRPRPPSPASAGKDGGRGSGSGGGPAISAQGRELLTELMQEGLGDHVLLLRLYEVRRG